MILSLVLCMSFASAAVNFVNTVNDVSTVSQGDSVVVSFQAEEDNYGDLTAITFNTPITMTYTTYSFDSESTITDVITSLSQDTTSGVMSLTINVPSGQALGTYEGDLILTGTYASSVDYTLPISITVTEASSDEPEQITECDLTGNPDNNLRIKDININNKGMSSTQFGDDNEWFPLEEIEVEIEIENKGNEKIEDIEIEWGLYDTQEDEWIIDLEDEKDFDLKEDKEEVITVSFNLNGDLDVDLEDLNDGDHYVFYVIVNGYDNDLEDNVCESDSEDIELIIESDFVILDEVDLPEMVSCGSELAISTNVYNIGDEDQDEVKVFIYNKELGISEKVEIGDIDAFDHEKLDVILEIPQDTEEKMYYLEFTVLDEDSDTYENDYDDDLSKFLIPFSVDGSCDAESKVLVSAVLESGGKAGQDLVIRATVTNIGTQLTTYNLGAAGYADWANSVDIDQGIIVLNEDESKDVLFTFDVMKGASGDKLFDIEVLSDGELIVKQPVSVTIEGKSGIGFGDAISSDNWYLWLIGALNIILVIIIIVVIVRITRK